MSARRLSLEPLSLPDVGARRLVDIAAETGFDHVGMVLHSPAETLPVDAIVADRGLRRETLARLRETGVGLHNFECFNLTPDLALTDCAAALECGRELGAQTATAIVWENGDRADVVAKLRGLADLAAGFGIRINLEYFAFSASLPTLGRTIELVRAAERDNVGIVVDLLHLVRTGGTLAELAAVDLSLIGGAQISDGPLRIVDEGALLEEAGGNRGVPGEGEFPIRDFVELLPPELVIGVEVPQVALIGRVSPEERARRLIAGARGALA